MKIKLFIALFFVTGLNCAEIPKEKSETMGWFAYGKSKLFEFYNKLTPTQKKVAVAGATTAAAVIFAKKYLEENPQVAQQSYNAVKSFVERHPKAIKIIGGAILVGAAIYIGKKIYDNYKENKRQEATELLNELVKSLTSQQKKIFRDNNIKRITPSILSDEKYFSSLTELQKAKLKTIETLLS